MIDGLKPYPKMKDSGLPWLGDIPEHWEIKRGKELFSCIDVRSESGGEELLTVSSDRGVVPRSSVIVTMFKAESYVGYKLCWPGDLVINSLWAWGGGLGVSRYHGIVSSAYGIYRLRAKYSEYTHYIHDLVRSAAFNWELQVRSKGIWRSRLQLTDEAFLGAPFPLPTETDQLGIVAFLNHVDRRIRRASRAKQKLIRLLEEQKQAIIHQAVTRGLNPDVRLKPSGVAWLGNVPEHWEVVRSKRVFVPRTELAQPDDIQLSATQAFGVISQAEYERRVGRKIVKIFRHLEKRKHVEPDDFVISMRSFQGGLERAWERGCIRSSYVVLRPLRGVSVPYFAKLFKSAGYIRALQSTADFIRDGQDLNYENFCAVDLPFPPIDEQSQIAAAVDRAVTRASVLGDRTRQELTLLEELRTGIISDVVTGKIDVQEIASRLPRESIDAANEYGDDDTDSSVTDEDFEGEVDEDAQEVANDD
jgi:type I restriction enzyme S subunit